MRSSLLVAAIAAASFPVTAGADRAREILERAARFYAPPSAEPMLIRVAWLGTHDLAGVDQARRPDGSEPHRAQHLLVIDPQGARAAMDTQQVGADGAPGVWRLQYTADAHRMTNRKSGQVFASSGPTAAHALRAVAWRIPRLAIAEMLAAPERVRGAARRDDGGRALDVITFEVVAGATVDVAIDQRGEVVSYAHDGERMRGRTRVQTLFKPAVVAPGLGRMPRGFQLVVGQVTALDLDVLDARATPRVDDHWFTVEPDRTTGAHIGQQQPGRVERIFPGGWMIFNVGGYNSFLVDVGGCLAVIDAAASYGGVQPVPGPPRARPISDEILDAARRAVPGKSVCWVVPTHHHDDHFGGIVGLARAGATVLTTPGNAALAREMLAGVRGARVEILERPRLFAGGPSHMEIRAIEGGLHADEMLFAWFPERGVAITADVTDYLGMEKRFLQLVEAEKLNIKTVYSVHSVRAASIDDLFADLDFPN
jgi:hypothetical protein